MGGKEHAQLDPLADVSRSLQAQGELVRELEGVPVDDVARAIGGEVVLAVRIADGQTGARAALRAHPYRAGEGRVVEVVVEGQDSVRGTPGGGEPVADELAPTGEVHDGLEPTERTGLHIERAAGTIPARTGDHMDDSGHRVGAV